MSRTLEGLYWQALALVRVIDFPGYRFEVVQRKPDADVYLLARFDAVNAATGKVELQTTRKWRLSRHMTASEMVQTAFKCVLTSLEHEARESFKYKGRAVFGPHFNVEDLVALVDQRNQDLRALQ